LADVYKISELFLLFLVTKVKMSILGIIPARFASTRFPGKPLAMIEGKSMLQRVYEQAALSKLTDLVVATDDKRIMDHVASFGGKAVMTGEAHASGTDRCYEAYQLMGASHRYVLNVQGDEPFLNPEQINELIAVCDGDVDLATQMIRCDSQEVLFDSGEVKIVLNEKKEAIYFSRSVIPFLKNKDPREWHLCHEYFRHVGMYAYRGEVLKQISALKPSPLEMAESLEQLRWVEAGYKITCVTTRFDSHCVDTPEDIEKVLRLLRR
jgi:3-deoxy-manno-octulosonate cytidylyltransferase (CMP-KDO synthetase)